MEETSGFSNKIAELHSHVIEQLLQCYQELFEHTGHGNMSIEMRYLKRGQKEVLINCGKEYRFIVDCCHVISGGTCYAGKMTEADKVEIKQGHK